jgi:ABC-type amino acid transport substrate-binding protein
MTKLLVFVWIFSLSGLSIAETLQFGLSPGLPALYINANDTHQGFVPALLKDVFEPVDISIDYKQMPRRRIIHRAQAGDVDLAMFPMFADSLDQIELPKGLYMGRVPVYTFDVYLYKLKTNELKINELLDLSGYSLGMHRQPKFIESFLLKTFETAGHIEYYKKPEYSLKALSAGRVDVVLLSEPLMKGLLSSITISDKLEEAFLVSRTGVYLVFSKEALGVKALELRDYSDRRLQELRRNGDIHRLLSVHGADAWFKD